MPAPQACPHRGFATRRKGDATRIMNRPGDEEKPEPAPRKDTQPEEVWHRLGRRLLNRGARLLEEGQAEEAISCLERANELSTENAAVLINLGGAYVMAGRHGEAVPVLEKARDIEPDNAMILINLGAAYLGNPVIATEEQQLRAIKAFESALVLNPGAPNVHYNLGLVFVDRGETELAIAAFRQALQTNPFDSDARRWLQRLQAEEEGERE
jgi:tetratricopeptide (TPR) repeat protein